MPADQAVGVILVNSLAGMNCCDRVGNGVVAACRELGLTLPVVMRLAGSDAAAGRAIIAGSGCR